MGKPFYASALGVAERISDSFSQSVRVKDSTDSDFAMVRAKQAIAMLGSMPDDAKFVLRIYGTDGDKYVYIEKVDGKIKVSEVVDGNPQEISTVDNIMTVDDLMGIVFSGSTGTPVSSEDPEFSKLLVDSLSRIRKMRDSGTVSGRRLRYRMNDGRSYMVSLSAIKDSQGMDMLGIKVSSDKAAYEDSIPMDNVSAPQVESIVSGIASILGNGVYALADAVSALHSWIPGAPVGTSASYMFVVDNTTTYMLLGLKLSPTKIAVSVLGEDRPMYLAYYDSSIESDAILRDISAVFYPQCGTVSDSVKKSLKQKSRSVSRKVMTRRSDSAGITALTKKIIDSNKKLSDGTLCYVMPVAKRKVSDSSKCGGKKKSRGRKVADAFRMVDFTGFSRYFSDLVEGLSENNPSVTGVVDLPTGTRVSVNIIRNGENYTVSAHLSESPAEVPAFYTNNYSSEKMLRELGRVDLMRALRDYMVDDASYAPTHTVTDSKADGAVVRRSQLSGARKQSDSARKVDGAVVKRVAKVKDAAKNVDAVFVYPATSKEVGDGKDHFPIDTEARGRAAIAYVNQYKELPKWYVGNGTLADMVSTVVDAVSKRYPSIKISDKSRVAAPAQVKDSNKRLDEWILGSLRKAGLESVVNLDTHKDGYRVSMQSIPDLYADIYLDGENAVIRYSTPDISGAEINAYAKFAGIPEDQAKNEIQRFRRWVMQVSKLDAKPVSELYTAVFDSVKVSDSDKDGFPSVSDDESVTVYGLLTNDDDLSDYRWEKVEVPGSEINHLGYNPIYIAVATATGYFTDGFSVVCAIAEYPNKQDGILYWDNATLQVRHVKKLSDLTSVLTSDKKFKRLIAYLASHPNVTKDLDPSVFDFSKLVADKGAILDSDVTLTKLRIPDDESVQVYGLAVNPDDPTDVHLETVTISGDQINSTGSDPLYLADFEFPNTYDIVAMVAEYPYKGQGIGYTDAVNNKYYHVDKLSDLKSMLSDTSFLEQLAVYFQEHPEETRSMSPVLYDYANIVE